jgi:hypothetical protein
MRWGSRRVTNPFFNFLGNDRVVTSARLRKERRLFKRRDKGSVTPCDPSYVFFSFSDAGFVFPLSFHLSMR